MARSSLPVLITGVNGQLGQALTRRLRFDATRREPLIVIGRSREAMDVTNSAQVAESIGGCRPFAVIHCAGYTNTHTAEQDPATCWRTNVLGVRHVAEACAKAGAVMLHVSTDFVFSHDFARAVNPAAKTLGFSEDDSPMAAGEYANSKLAAELQLHQVRLANPKFRYLIFRTSGMFEPPSRPDSRNFLFAIASRLKQSRAAIPVRDDCTTTIASVDYVAEVLDWAMVELAPKLTEPDVYHVANAGAVNWFGLAQELAAEFNQPASRIIPTSRDGYARMSGRPAASLPVYTPLNCRKLAAVRRVAAPSWREALRDWIHQYHTQA